MFVLPTIVALGIFAPPISNDKLFADMDFASGAKYAFGMLPPEKVCDAKVKQALWSPDGKFIAFEVSDYGFNTTSAAAIFLDPDLAAQQTESRRVMVWNAETDKTQQMFAMPDGAEVNNVEWLANTKVLFVSLDESAAINKTKRAAAAQAQYTQTLGIVFPETGRFQSLYSGTAANAVFATLSPIKSFGALVEMIDDPQNQAAPPESHRWQMVAEFFDASGHVGQNITLPPNSVLGWDFKTGDPVVSEFIRTPGSKSKRQFYSLDTATGKLTLLTTAPNQGAYLSSYERRDMNAKTGIALYEANPTVKSKDFAGVAGTIWLRVDGGAANTAAVVTTDGQQGDISPAGDAIMYQSKGSAYVRQLFKVSKDAYAMYRKRLAQQLAINDAKQTALAFLMMANDANDMLPGQGSSWQSMIDPYLKDNGISSGFNYTFAGGNMGLVDSPATTILGYIDGPDGRAVAYTDGHVTWIPNP